MLRLGHTTEIIFSNDDHHMKTGVHFHVLMCSYDHMTYGSTPGSAKGLDTYSLVAK